MKTLILILLILTTSMVSAEIFKCTANDGKIVYQDNACPDKTESENLITQELNPEKIAKAQQQLTLELKQRAAEQEMKRQQEIKEREISALERNAIANEDMARATRYRAQVEQEKNRQPTSNSYFYYPYPRDYHKPRPKPKPVQPIEKPARPPIRLQR